MQTDRAKATTDRLCSTETENEDGAPPDFSRAVNLDRLCSLLIDVNRCDTDVGSLFAIDLLWD